MSKPTITVEGVLNELVKPAIEATAALPPIPDWFIGHTNHKPGTKEYRRQWEIREQLLTLADEADNLVLSHVVRTIGRRVGNEPNPKPVPANYPMDRKTASGMIKDTNTGAVREAPIDNENPGGFY